MATGWSVGFAAGSRAERAACAELVRAAGCICLILAGFGDFGGEAVAHPRGEGIVELEIVEHDHRCPAAIAAAIEARGRE